MCLRIATTVKSPKVNKDGYCVGYKAILKDNYSVYQHYKYVKGINKSNRENKNVSFTERSCGVYDGIHVYLNSEFANRDIRWRDADKIIKVYFKPNDIVSTGYFFGRDCAVVMKVLVKSLNGVKLKG